MERMDASNDAHEPQQSPSPKAIVCIYAQVDEPFYKELQTHLAVWQDKGEIQWLELTSGMAVEETQRAFLQQADLILLLISADFFVPRTCRKTLEQALVEHKQRGVPVVPVIVRACMWKESDCGELQALPANEQPIVEWEHRDRAYEQIRAGLARLLFGLTRSKASRPQLFQARDLPKSYVPRPAAFQQIKSALLAQDGKRTAAITTALRGAGGFGKTTLALALCHDSEIQAAFPDGVLWVELGEKPPRPVDLLNGLLRSLEPSLSGTITLEEARDHWRTALHNWAGLLVIDDVWLASALEPLLEGGPHCVRLITTRNDQLLPEETVRIWVDAMEPDEAVAVLHRGLPDEQGDLPRWQALVKRLGCWPLLLTLANGMLVSRIIYGQPVEEALTAIEQAYETRGVTAFQLDQANARQRTADACLAISIQYLDRSAPPHYNAVERYQELVVFPEDMDIPLVTLEIFWKGSGGLEPWETKELCIRLHRLSLLLTCDLSKGTIRLHDVLRSYLIQRTGPNLSSLHSWFLDVSQRQMHLKRWADLPEQEGYFWHYLIQHFCQANGQKALQNTLTDLDYLIRKALFVGISALEADFLLASDFEQTRSLEDAPSHFASLHRKIVQISHLLHQAHTSAEMGGLLLSYLGFDHPFVEQRPDIERTLPRPFLTAAHPFPEQSASALLRTFQGHADSVTGCAFSPDGYFILSASADKTLKVWEVSTGIELLTLQGHTNWVNGCAFSPDGRFILSASADSTLKVWNASTGAELLTLQGHINWVSDCAFSPDGRFILSASADKTLKVWDSSTGAELLTLQGHTSPVAGCAFSPDGRFILSASDDKTLKVWDSSTGAELLTLQGHTRPVAGCAFCPDGRFILSASADETLKVWDSSTGTELLTLRGHTGSATRCAFSPDGRFILSASDDKTLKVWDAFTGAELLTLQGHADWVSGCAFSPDGRFILSASDDETLKVWDSSTGAELLTLQGHTNWVTGCAFSPDGRFILSASADGTLKVWDSSTGAELLTLQGHTSLVYGCAFSPDGRSLLSASDDGTLKAWDASTGAELLTLQGHTGSVAGCAFSPDGRFILSASLDRTLKVWDSSTGAERLTLQGHTNMVTGCAYSPDGRFILSASDDETIKVWDASTGAELLTLQGHTDPVTNCVFSPDGRFILSASLDRTLKVWDSFTVQCRLTFPLDGALYGCAFHPEGLFLVAYGSGGIYVLRLMV